MIADVREGGRLLTSNRTAATVDPLCDHCGIPRSTAPMVFGYALVEPSPAACGWLIDQVPYAEDAQQLLAAHEGWRRGVEARLASMVQTGGLKIWLPIALPDERVVPFFGGSPTQDWDAAASMLVKATTDEGATLRIVDLTGAIAKDLDQRLRRFPGAYVHAVLGSGGSLDPLSGIRDPADAAALLADVFRADDDRRGRNAAAASQGLLHILVRALDPSSPLLVDRLRAAAELALYATSSGLLSASEEATILSGLRASVSANPLMFNQLFELEALLALVAPFTAGSGPFRNGGDPKRARVSLLQLDPRVSRVQRELAIDVLAARVALEMGHDDGQTTTLVLGGDAVADRLLDSMARAAETCGSRLLVFFERLDDTTRSRLGWRGSSIAGFFRLANHRDAAEAADFLGRQHDFVLAGVSESRSRSFEWGWSTAASAGTDRSTSHSWGLGANFSRTTSTAQSRSRTTGTSGGGSATSGTAKDYARVYEHLVEPAVFQGLGPGAVMLVDIGRRAVRLGTCAREVTRSKLVDWSHQVAIADA